MNTGMNGRLNFWQGFPCLFYQEIYQEIALLLETYLIQLKLSMHQALLPQFWKGAHL